MNKIKWIISQKNNGLNGSIVHQFQLDPTIAQLLINRGLKEAKEIEDFLNPSLNQLNNPFLFPEISKAIERIKEAFSNDEKILVYGDYDVDGMTGTALLFSVLSKFSTNIYYYIPDRFEEGYGISQKAIEFVSRYHFSLIITVDCGITSNHKIEQLNNLQVDTIVTDHHESLQKLPPAYAIINPKSCEYPFKELAGVGVAYKLSQALFQTFGKRPESLEEHLDLVAVGTIADSVPLLGENRILVKYGLDKLSTSHKRGLQMLLEYHNNDFSNSVLARDISFGLIPVLNSTGRIDNPQQAVDLLLTDSSYRAQHLINKMLKLNERRKALTLKVLEEAREIANKKILLEEQKILVLSSRKWHPGLVGIVASRLMEEFSQPVMMISINKGIGKGSGRNQGEFDFSKILSECSELLNQYGGHQYAAGITISEEKIDLFGEKINRILKTNPLINQFGQSVIKIDSLIDFNEINWNLLNFLDKMKPFGPGNTEPVFGGYKFPLFSWKRVGKDEKHLKLVLGKSGNCIDGIAFQMAEKILDIKKDRTIDVAFQLSKNYWKGKNSLQLMVKDIK